MPTPKELRKNAEDCLTLARETREMYVKMALIELATEFCVMAQHLEPEARPRGASHLRLSFGCEPKRPESKGLVSPFSIPKSVLQNFLEPLDPPRCVCRRASGRLAGDHHFQAVTHFSQCSDAKFAWQ
jgi:hypothetical protein